MDEYRAKNRQQFPGDIKPKDDKDKDGPFIPVTVRGEPPIVPEDMIDAVFVIGKLFKAVILPMLVLVGVAVFSYFVGVLCARLVTLIN